MSSKVISNAARIPKADKKAAMILAEMFRTVMDEEEEVKDEDMAAYSDMLEAEDAEMAPVVIAYVQPKAADDDQFIVNSVDDIRMKSNKPSFSVNWADGSKDWRRFDELAEQEDGELVVNEKLQEFLNLRGLVDPDTFYKILKKKKKLTLKDFADMSSESAQERYKNWGVETKAALKAVEEVEDLEAAKAVVQKELNEIKDEEMDEDDGVIEELNEDTENKPLLSPQLLAFYKRYDRKPEKEAELEEVEEEVKEAAEEAENLDEASKAGPMVSPSSMHASLRKMDAVKAFVEEIKKKAAIKNIINAAESMQIASVQLARLVLYQESKSHSKNAPYEDISYGPLSYRFVLDCINEAMGSPKGSPIAMSLRARQNTCSESVNANTTSKDFPTVGSKLRSGITYAERSADFLKDKTELLRHFNGIVDRATQILTLLNDATPLKRQKILKGIDDYSKEFSEIRQDSKPAFFGVGRDLDPTITPTNLGDKARQEIEEISSRIVHKHTSLKDASGSPFPFHGAFWNGEQTLSVGTKLGYYEGRIITECDNTEMHPEKPSEYSLEVAKYMVLVDATKASESNWARYINDGSHGRPESDDLTNVRFAKDGSVIATRPIHRGEELFVRYGIDYWRFF
jgi:hypothetical protein